MATELIVFALALGAVLRLTRLVVEDSITAPIRELLDRGSTRKNGRPRRLVAFLAALTACSWCTSVWVAFGVLAPVWARYAYDWALYPLAALTVSWLVGIAVSWLDSPPPARHLIHHAPEPFVAWVGDERATVPASHTGN